MQRLEAALQGWAQKLVREEVPADPATPTLALGDMAEAIALLSASAGSASTTDDALASHPFVLAMSHRHEQALGTLAQEMREALLGQTKRAEAAESQVMDLEAEVASLEAALDRIISAHGGDVEQLVAGLGSPAARPAARPPRPPAAGAAGSGATAALQHARALLAQHGAGAEGAGRGAPPSPPAAGAKGQAAAPSSPASTASSLPDRVRESVAGLDAFMAGRQGAGGAHPGGHGAPSDSTVRHSPPVAAHHRPPPSPALEAEVRRLQAELGESQAALAASRAALDKLKRSTAEHAAMVADAVRQEGKLSASVALEAAQRRAEAAEEKLASQAGELQELTAERDEFFAAAQETAQQLSDIVTTTEAAFEERDALAAQVKALQQAWPRGLPMPVSPAQQGAAATEPVDDEKPCAAPPSPGTATGSAGHAGGTHAAAQEHSRGDALHGMQGMVSRLEEKLNAARADNAALRSSIAASGALESPAPHATTLPHSAAAGPRGGPLSASELRDATGFDADLSGDTRITGRYSRYLDESAAAQESEGGAPPSPSGSSHHGPGPGVSRWAGSQHQLQPQHGPSIRGLTRPLATSGGLGSSTHSSSWGPGDGPVTVTMSRDVGASFIVAEGSTLQIHNSPHSS